ncbi:ABC transporter substrate-binding protein [Mahella sp.]|uniref:ABC transporter substrate-binding protein n=1 Tax=Mahella sp. TaxID=2798721 RepID=UPI0025C022AC|nr:ABC transporter substrate-binding protein [Mahella sp.]MBZ4666328.1 transporter substrate binding protein [Mahella sp.]
MFKKVVSLILVFIVAVALAACSGGGTTSTRSGEVITIGILQLVEHPALDAAREGFVEALKEAGYEDGVNIKLDLQNAQGEIPNASTIASKFVGDKVDMILAIATPAAQAAANATKDIPILITAVTDPVVAGLAKSLDKPGGNVTGTTDMNPVAEQLQLIKDLLPDAKNVGFLYNSGEVNSKVQLDIAKEAASKMDLNIVEATVTNSSEVTQATQSLMGRVDAIYVPTDNTIVSAIGAVVKVANDNKVPVIGSEKGQVVGGALAAKGIDYKELGKQTGRIAVEVLRGKKPADLPIESAETITLIINKKAASTIGVAIPEALLSKADEVIE